MSERDHDQPQPSGPEEDIRWQRRRARLRPKHRAEVEARRTAQARHQAAEARRELEEMRAAASRKGVLTWLLGSLWRTEVQTLNSKIDRLERELGTLKTDRRELLKRFRKMERRLDRTVKGGAG